MRNYNHLWICLFMALCHINRAFSGVCFKRYKEKTGACRKTLRVLGSDVTYKDCCRNPKGRAWKVSGGSQCFKCVKIVDGNWGDWYVETPCSATCDSGVYTRRRACNNPEPKHGGRFCVGNSTDVHSCFSGKRCPIDGQWGQWSAWSVCSKSCGPGNRIRSKACNNPPPQFGGKDCRGLSEQFKKCTQVENCPIHGGWTSWSSWSACSVTCGFGESTRTRSCTNPAPKYNGNKCKEDGGSSTRLCSTTLCKGKDGKSGGEGSGSGSGSGDGIESGSGSGSGSGSAKRDFDDSEDGDSLVVISPMRPTTRVTKAMLNTTVITQLTVATTKKPVVGQSTEPSMSGSGDVQSDTEET